MDRPSSLTTISRYGLAFAVGLFAIFLRVWLTPFLGVDNPYHTAWAAVAFSAWYCGLGPSILTTLTSLFGVWFWFLTSGMSAIALDRNEISGMLSFLFFSGVILAFGEATRRSKASMDLAEQSARESEAQLRLVNQNMQREIERHITELEQKTIQTMEQAKFIDLANDAIFVRSANDTISYWNEGAERLYGWTKEEAVGELTDQLLRTVFPVPLSEIAKTDRWEGELIHTRRDGSAITVASRWTTLRDSDGKFTGWLEINTDITARKRAEEAARCLSGRILSLQDDERRRIARELHDSLGQYLVSIKLNLDLLAQRISEPAQNVLLSECLQSVEACLTETRSISHLLHPPLLDEAGFASAARWYVEGFAQRSSFEVEVDFPPTMRRLNRDVETALFRVLQEGLTNVHRHSEGSAARVVLKVDDEKIQLQITDNGRGIPPDRLRSLRNDPSATGVGLAGMRERIRELSGSFEIESAHSGTTITAAIPILQPAQPSPQVEDRNDANRGASAA